MRRCRGLVVRPEPADQAALVFRGALVVGGGAGVVFQHQRNDFLPVRRLGGWGIRVQLAGGVGVFEGIADGIAQDFAV